MERRERIAAADTVRVISMLSVLMLHVTSGFIFLPAEFSVGGMNLGFIINQGVRYCVPLFFLLSGFSLELTYRGQGYVSFLLSRAKKIVLPYLFWTFLYYLIQTEQFTLKELLCHLLWGTAAPHLYFIAALVQLYLLFLPLHWLLKCRPVLLLLGAFVISLFFQWSVYLVVFDMHVFPMVLRPYILKTWMPWLFIFALGMLLARTRERWQPYAARHSLAWLCALCVFAAFYVVDSQVTYSYDLSIKPILFLYVPLAFLCFFSLGEAIGKYRPIQAAISLVSRHSMTVFFCHIFVLQQLRQFPVFQTAVSGMLLLGAGVIALSLLFAVGVDTAVAGIKKLPGLGRPGRQQGK